MLDKKKPEYRLYQHFGLIEDLDRLNETTIHRAGSSVTTVVSKLTGDHADRWEKMKGCGGRGHRCCICNIRISHWSLHTHRFPHLNLGQMREAGFPSALAGVAPTARFVSPALHDCKGIAKKIFGILDDATRAVLEQACRKHGFDVTQNAKGSQIRELVTLMCTPEFRPRCTLPFRWLFLSMSELIDFRYSDVPWLVWGEKEEAAYAPFIRARPAGHILLMLMEYVKAGCTRNAYCHSMEHWWDPQDALPFALSDELEERENGMRKARTSLSSPQTYEQILAMAEESEWTGRTKQRKSFSEAGFLGTQKVLVCNCVHGSARKRLAAHVLCQQLSKMKQWAAPNFNILINTSHVVFKFSSGVGSIRVCVCEKSFRKQTFRPWTDEPGSLQVLERKAREEMDASDEEEESVGEEESESDEEEENEKSEESTDEDAVTCPICHVSLKYSSLAAHIDAKHRAAVKECLCKVKCPRCKQTVSVNGLSQHMYWKHPDFFEQRNRCQLCYKLLPTKAELNAHLKLHKLR